MYAEKFFVAGKTRAIDYAAAELIRRGFPLTREPESADWALLDVPVREDPGDILPLLPKTATVIGGNLQRIRGIQTLDLLQDPVYLAQNANITAHCAVKIALNRLDVILQDQPVLVLGWGRIGKCLACLLRNLGAAVSVYARKEADRAMLSALGYGTGTLTDLDRYRVIFNTVPAPLLSREDGQNCLKIDLASAAGMEGPDVIVARGLPGKEAPESSGLLIARRLLHLMKGVFL